MLTNTLYFAVLVLLTGVPVFLWEDIRNILCLFTVQLIRKCRKSNFCKSYPRLIASWIANYTKLIIPLWNRPKDIPPCLLKGISHGSMKFVQLGHRGSLRKSHCITDPVPQKWSERKG